MKYGYILVVSAIVCMSLACGAASEGYRYFRVPTIRMVHEIVDEKISPLQINLARSVPSLGDATNSYWRAYTNGVVWMEFTPVGTTTNQWASTTSGSVSLQFGAGGWYLLPVGNVSGQWTDEHLEFPASAVSSSGISVERFWLYSAASEDRDLPQTFDELWAAGMVNNKVVAHGLGFAMTNHLGESLGNFAPDSSSTWRIYKDKILQKEWGLKREYLDDNYYTYTATASGIGTTSFHAPKNALSLTFQLNGTNYFLDAIWPYFPTGTSYVDSSDLDKILAKIDALALRVVHLEGLHGITNSAESVFANSLSEETIRSTAPIAHVLYDAYQTKNSVRKSYIAMSGGNLVFEGSNLKNTTVRMELLENSIPVYSADFPSVWKSEDIGGHVLTLDGVYLVAKIAEYCDSSKTTAVRFTITTDNGSVTRTVDVEW